MSQTGKIDDGQQFLQHGRTKATVDRMGTRALVKIILEEHDLETLLINTGTWKTMEWQCLLAIYFIVMYNHITKELPPILSVIVNYHRYVC